MGVVGSMEPTAAEISTLGLETLGPMAQWAGMRDADVEALAKFLGFEPQEFSDSHCRLLCTMTAETFAQALSQWQIGGQAVSLRAQMAARALHAGAVAVCRPQPVVTASPASQTPDTQALMGQAIMALANAVNNKDARKVKVSQVLDPADSSDLPLPKPDDVTQWFANYRQIKGGDPLPDREPTPEQIAALHSRVITYRLEPYGDFSLLTPNGKRFAKEMKFSSWIPMEDGTFQNILLPGPASFTVWTSCWRVYEVILLMLRDVDKNGDECMVVTPIAFEHYFESFALLNRENPEAWHLTVQAEDRCRSEHFPRLWRTLAARFGRNPTWSEVFVAAADDDRYWDKEVRRPAISTLARSKTASSKMLSVEEDAASKVADAVQEMKAAGKQRGRAHGKEKGNGKKPPGKVSPPPAPHIVQRPSKGDEAHPKKDHKGRYLTIDGGRDICFRYNNGKCKEPCPMKRAHFCQICLKKACKASSHSKAD